MKKHRGLLLVVALLLVVVVGGVATLTYSRYLTASEGASTAKVAPWKIKVNDTNVVETKQFTGSEITWTQNDYVSDGYIAPNREGTFKIKIDPTGSKVAVDYEIQIDTADMASANKNIRITSVDVDGTVITVSDGKYSGTITLDEVSMAGGKYANINSLYYLYTGQTYWTLSPSNFNSNNTFANVGYVNSTGTLSNNSVTNANGVRPDSYLLLYLTFLVQLIMVGCRWR